MVRREMESGSEYGVGSRQADAFGSFDFRASGFLRVSDLQFGLYAVSFLHMDTGFSQTFSDKRLTIIYIHQTMIWKLESIL